MKSIRRVSCFIILLVFVSLSWVGCVTHQVYNTNKPAIQVEQATKTDIRSFGFKSGENPYIEPSSLIRGKIDEFFIVKFSFNLSETKNISILAEAQDDKGASIGRFYTADKFVQYWKLRDAYDEDDNPYGNAKQVSIQSSCLSSFEFSQKPGVREYYLPFVSSYPIKRPATIHIQVVADDVIIVDKNFVLE